MKKKRKEFENIYDFHVHINDLGLGTTRKILYTLLKPYYEYVDVKQLPQGKKG